jgi:alkylation response protein AidB-like acyl-CoA dehydrogenase
VVNGQKVWSSFAEHAGWCILLARTDREAPKRKGISFFLLDMACPGVDVRLIRQINGEAEFCELFLTDVEIPAANLVGAENGGWAVAQTTLSTERGPAMVAVTEQLRRQLDGLTDLLLDHGLAGDAAVRAELGRAYAEVEIAHHLGERLIAALMNDTVGPTDSSIFKVYFSELLQRVTEVGLRYEGLAGLLARPGGGGPSGVSGVWLLDHLSSWMYTIAGGTNEIQRNIIAERGFALPRDPVAS